MGGKKRLVHRTIVEKHTEGRQKKRKLFFGTYIFLPLLTLCTPAHALTENLHKSAEQTKASKTNQCEWNVNELLERGEKVHEIIRKKDYTFVLTKTSLLVLYEKHCKLKDLKEDVTLDYHYFRINMRKILEPGLVAWAQSDDTCYFLTQDGVLTVIPVGEAKDGLPAYQISSDVSNAKMVYSSGFLFIAPVSGYLMVVSFFNDAGSKSIPIPLEALDSELLFDGDKLFFGKKGAEKAEIRINGKSINDVRLITE